MICEVLDGDSLVKAFKFCDEPKRNDAYVLLGDMWSATEMIDGLRHEIGRMRGWKGYVQGRGYARFVSPTENTLTILCANQPHRTRGMIIRENDMVLYQDNVKSEVLENLHILASCDSPDENEAVECDELDAFLNSFKIIKE